MCVRDYCVRHSCAYSVQSCGTVVTFHAPLVSPRTAQNVSVPCPSRSAKLEGAGLAEVFLVGCVVSP